MPNYNAQSLQPNARSANVVAVRIGTTTIAFAQVASPSHNFGAQQLYGVGSPMPQEIQQFQISPSIALDFFSLTDTGIANLAGGQDITTMLAGNQFNITLMDGAGGNTYRTYVGCVCATDTGNVPANAPFTETLTFLCMDVWDSVSGQSIVNPGNAAYSVPTAALAGAVAGSLGVQAAG